MKKLFSSLFVMIIISITLFGAHAEPAHPSAFANRYFKILYAKTDDVENLSLIYNYDYYLKGGFSQGKYVDYSLVEFSSNNAEQKPYFNRFGNNNEYYEYSEKTNLLFEYNKNRKERAQVPYHLFFEDLLHHLLQNHQF